MYVAGLCAHYNGDLGKGLEYFGKAHRMDPNHHKTNVMLLKTKSLQEKKENGDKFYKAGQFHEARKLYTEALQIDPLNANTNSRLYFNRALMDSKMGNNQTAIADCTNALKIRPKYRKALLLRAKCYNAMEELEECIDDYEAALDIERSSDIQQALNAVKIVLDGNVFRWYASICSHFIMALQKKKQQTSVFFSLHISAKQKQ